MQGCSDSGASNGQAEFISPRFPEIGGRSIDPDREAAAPMPPRDWQHRRPFLVDPVATAGDEPLTLSGQPRQPGISSASTSVATNAMMRLRSLGLRMR